MPILTFFNGNAIKNYFSCLFFVILIPFADKMYTITTQSMTVDTRVLMIQSKLGTFYWHSFKTTANDRIGPETLTYIVPFKNTNRCSVHFSQRREGHIEHIQINTSNMIKPLLDQQTKLTIRFCSL